MSLFESFIYGIIQALCEFLPISSSGHLAFLPTVLEIKDPGVTFDLFLHVGTALSLLVYFRKKIAPITRSKIKILSNPSSFFNHQGEDAYTVNLMVATATSIMAILVLKPLAEAYGRQLWLIALNLFVFGFLLYFFDARKGFQKNEGELFKVNFPFSFKMGLAQALAIFPGVSRSGVTLTMGRALSFERRVVGEFTFLLSLPIIFLGASYKAYKLYQDPSQISFEWNAMLVGVFVSFALGLVVIHFFLKFINKVPFAAFFIYRSAIALLVLKLGGDL